MTLEKETASEAGTVSYAVLTAYHLERIKLRGDGTPRSQKTLDNHESAIRKWCAYTERGPDEGRATTPHKINPREVMVGDELGRAFSKSLDDYLKHLESKGCNTQTVSDRKSIAKMVRESWLQLCKEGQIPDRFAEALDYLIRLHHASESDVEHELDLPHGLLREWISGEVAPSPWDPPVRALEEYFAVKVGTLSAKLPLTGLQITGELPSKNTAFRANLSALRSVPYGLTELTPLLLRQWRLIKEFFTVPVVSALGPYKRRGVWRDSPDTGECPTGDKHLRNMLCFFGFASLDPEAEEPLLRGKGLPPEQLTWAMVGVPEYVFDFLEFRRRRTHNNLFNAFTQNFLLWSMQLLRPETGFLWQHPEFGKTLPDPVRPARWRAWCEANRAVIRDKYQELFAAGNAVGDDEEFYDEDDMESEDGGRRAAARNNRLVGKGRDSFEIVRPYIEDLNVPVSVLWDMARNMRADADRRKPGLRHDLAVLKRDLFYVTMISFNPLRCRNYSRMKFVPQDWEEFRRACAEYAVTGDPASVYVRAARWSNLYQKPDGSWWVRFPKGAFKNEKGAARKPYDVPVVEEVWPALVDYIFKYRPVLLEAMRRAINSYRTKNGLAVLSREQEERIEKCPYVLRPSVYFFHATRNAKKKRRTGAEPMKPGRVSKIIYDSSRKYLPGCKGFWSHACRHLVASTYIKHKPEGWEVAAGILHITATMVRKHYAWVRAADTVKIFNDDIMKLKREYDACGPVVKKAA
ncbi:MAG TPA: hypothetical protein VF736_14375 [Pyrinomonadaceae bacterium]|jgi:integrase